MSTVAIAYTKDKHRSLESVHDLVREALEYIGGFEAFVRPGESVLIKPDQSLPHSAAEGSTTDPLLVGALVRMARLAGASRVMVGASSSGFLNSLECMRQTGVAATAEAEGAELVDLGSDDVPNRDIDLPEGRVLRQARLPVPLLDAEVVIAVPKARTDYLDMIAGSLDLVAGSLNQSWRAAQSMHDDLMERYADVMTVLQPDLWITDALICGEGDGPHANRPHWCGCILASADPVATDVAIAMILGLDYKKLQLMKLAEERGIGKSSAVFLGSTPERVAFRAWPAHDGVGYLPVNVLIGKGVTKSGTVGHVKSALEELLRNGLLKPALPDGKTLTLMLGDADDPDFEHHLANGPYVVCDDAAQSKYKEDPRTHFIPGHPVLSTVQDDLTNILQPKKRPLLDFFLPAHNEPEPVSPPISRPVAEFSKPAPVEAVALGSLLLGAILLASPLGKRH